jgi:hypothetical protein
MVLNVILLRKGNYDVCGMIDSTNIEEFFETITESEESRTPFRFVESFYDLKGREWGRRFVSLETGEIIDYVLAKHVAVRTKKIGVSLN